MNQILNNSDLVVVSISYSKKNYNFVDKKFFSKMKKSPVFVNTSRGEVVDEKALIYALKNKKIKCALLDVLKDEQFMDKKENILLNYSKNNPNLIITPHMAGLTYESEKKAFMISVNNIIKFFKS